MTLFFYLCFLLLVSLVILKFLFQTKRFKNFPPGPPYLPVIGNFHQLKQPLHRTFRDLSQKYGQIFSLMFGSCFVVVVSSPSLVQECFSKNDIILSNRPKLLIGKYIGYDYTAVGFSPYGDHWRNLRRIISLEVLSSYRLNSSLEIRRDEIMRLIQKLAQDSCKDFAKVELKSKFLELTFNTMMRILAGKWYFGEDLDASEVEEAKQFIDIIKELGMFSDQDFIPTMRSRWFDFVSEKSLKRIGQRLDAFVQGLIDEHRDEKRITNSMIYHLLSQQRSQPNYYTDQIIKGLILFLFQTRRFKKFPPGPPYLPIIGNLHQLEQPLHRTFRDLSQKYGQIFSLIFGSRLVVVVSSLSLVQECFTKNDIILSNRPKLLIGKYIGYDYTAIGFSPYGDHWRNLRRIISLEVLSSYRLNSSSKIRRDEIMRLIQKLAQDSCKDFAKVELKSKFLELTFNTMMRILTGKRYFGEDLDASEVEEAKQFIEIIKELGMFNDRDFIPTMKSRWFDFVSEKSLKRIGQRLDAFVQGLIDEHRDEKRNTNSMIYHLLSQQRAQPNYYTDQIIKGLILDLLSGGTDTSAVTLEWAMSNLLNHPEVLKKAIKEIDSLTGQDRLLDESDISNLPYLQNILHETLRLHPAAPLLVPRLSSEDCIIGEYKVPKNTTLFVNAWAIHTDPKLWNDPMLFKPERFEREGEVKKLLSFGLGRRACPGANLAQRTVSLTLGLFIQCFEWKRIKEEEAICMTEGRGVTVPKKIPLEAICRVRQLSAIKDILY